MRVSITWASIAILVAALVLGVACSSSDDPDKTSTPTVAPTREATASATPAVVSTVTAEPTAPLTPSATILVNELDVRLHPLHTSEVIETLHKGDRVEIDQRRFDWVRLVQGGWINRHFEGVELSVPFDSLLEFVTARHPPEARTGVALIDRVIDAVIDGDASALVAVAELEERACSASNGDTGDLPCGDDVAVGTLLPSFNFVGCHGNPEIEEDLEDAFGRMVTTQGPFALYAVFQTDIGHHLVFVGNNGAAVEMPLDDDGLIQHVNHGCGQ